MAKINFVEQSKKAAKQSAGIVVGSLFPVAKVNGYSFKWKGQVRDENNDLVNISGRDLIQNLLDSGCFDVDAKGYTKGMLVTKNNRKRADKKDPDFLVYAYPESK